MRPIFLLFFSLSLALLAAAPTPARAEQDAGATADAKDNATREFWDWLNQGDVAYRLGSLPEALRLYQSGQAVAERQSQADPANAEWQHLLSVSYNRIGDVLAEQSKFFSEPDNGIRVLQELSGPYEWISRIRLMERGKLDDALKALRDSQTIIERLAKANPANVEWQRELAGSCQRISKVLAALGKSDDALKAALDSQAIIERLANVDPAYSRELQPRDLSKSYNRIGSVLMVQGKWDDALKAARDSQAIIERIAKADPANAELQRDLSASYDRISGILVSGFLVLQNKEDDALNAFHDGLAIVERNAKANPANVEWQRDLSVFYSKLGGILAAQRKLDDALKAFRDSQATIERIAKADPANAELQRDLSASYDRIGNFMLQQSNNYGALNAFRDGLAIRERLAKADPANARWQRDLLVSYVRITHLLSSYGKKDDALKANGDAVAIAERLAKSDPADAQRQVELMGCYANLGMLHADKGDKAEALRLFQRGRAIAETIRHEGWKQRVVLEEFDIQIAALGEADGQEGNVGQENKPVEVAGKADATTSDKVQVTVGASGEAKWFTPGAGKDESFSDCASDCPEMVVAPGGSFMMGSPKDEPGRSVSEGPQHKVTFKQPFAVGKYAVTFAEWDACVADGGCGGYKPEDRGWGRGDRPVINVNSDDAKAYAAWLSKKTGKTYRLLSEAEREYVARAGTTTPFWWGSSITPDQANYDSTRVYKGGGEEGEYRGRTMPVKSFQPNPWGLYQVHGNVDEWTEDCLRDDYNGAPKDGSARTTGWCDLHVLRGGSFRGLPEGLRAAHRNGWNPLIRFNYIGFRVARTLNP